ncbi:MAG: heme exporter protein CcmD [Kistimonas sp.]|nr:heme exporter protein CcmD [Kistimonas sp.]
MYFDSLGELLSMQGHGFYVWTAYSLGFSVLLWNFLSPVLHGRRQRAHIKRRLRRESAREHRL